VNLPELVLAEVCQEIGLILHRIGRAPEEDMVVLLGDSGIVTGCNFHVRMGSGRQMIKKRPELDPLVAEDVRARCPTGTQFLNRIAHDPIVILELEGYDVEWHAGRITNLPGKGEILLPRTLAERLQLVFQPHFEIICDNIIGWISGEFPQSRGAVYTAGKKHCVAHVPNLPSVYRTVNPPAKQ